MLLVEWIRGNLPAVSFVCIVGIAFIWIVWGLARLLRGLDRNIRS